MKNLRVFLIGGVLTGATLFASAQTIGLGFGENNTKMGGGASEMEKGMAEAQKQMDAMPPAQGKMIKDLMTKQALVWASQQAPCRSRPA